MLFQFKNKTNDFTILDQGPANFWGLCCDLSITSLWEGSGPQAGAGPLVPGNGKGTLPSSLQ